MSPQDVQAILVDFERRATLRSRRGDGRETWRFHLGEHAYDLHFYPDDDTVVRRYVGGADAAREFTQLQALQKLTIPAARVIANLKGFRLGQRKGDACIVVHDPRAPSLDALLRDTSKLTHRETLALMASLIERLESLHRQKMCPTPLRVHDFARRGDLVIVSEGSTRMAGIVEPARLAELDQSTRHVTSVTQRLRTWRHFSDDPPPRRDHLLRGLARQMARDAARGTGESFGAMAHDGWVGRFTRRVPLTLPWSGASGLVIDRSDWLAGWSTLMEAGGEVLKADESSHVSTRTLTLNDQAVEVVVKRPSFKPGLRGTIDRFRQARVMRGWIKTWRILAAGLPCEFPLLVLERRQGPRLIDQLVVFERIPGPTLAAIHLDALNPRERQRLFYACGRTLRLLERAGYVHCDAKSSNWIVWTDPQGSPRPILVDLDGARPFGRRGLSAPRLIRSLREQGQGTDADAAQIHAGYRIGSHLSQSRDASAARAQ